jgi:hypothetical protein
MKIEITYWDGMHPSRRYQAAALGKVGYGPTFRAAIINLLDHMDEDEP